MRASNKFSASRYVRLAPPIRQRFRQLRPVPWTIQTTYWTLVAVTVVDAIISVVRFATTDWSAYLEKTVGTSQFNGHTVVVTTAQAMTTKIVSFVLGVAILGFFYLLAHLAKQGRGWTRVVLLLWCVIEVVGDIASPELIGSARSAAVAFAVVMLWLPPSTRFFRAVKSDRIRFKSRQLV